MSLQDLNNYFIEVFNGCHRGQILAVIQLSSDNIAAATKNYFAESVRFIPQIRTPGQVDWHAWKGYLSSVRLGLLTAYISKHRSRKVNSCWSENDSLLSKLSSCLVLGSTRRLLLEMYLTHTKIPSAINGIYKTEGSRPSINKFYTSVTFINHLIIISKSMFCLFILRFQI